MAMRKTLTEIDDAAALERETAARFEQLINEKELLKRAVAKLEPQIADTDGLVALAEIAKLAERIPEGLQTRASRFVAGGFIAKTVIASAVADALTDARVRLADLEDTMAKVRRRQEVNAERMKEFE